MILSLLATSFAGPVEGYAVQAPLALPEKGAALVDLASLATLPWPEDLLLLNGANEEIPWEMIEGEGKEERTWRDLAWDYEGAPPSGRVSVIDTRQIGHPIDKIRVDPMQERVRFRLLGITWLRWIGDVAVNLKVTDLAGKVLAEELVWQVRFPSGLENDLVVDVPELPPGKYRLVADSAVDWGRVQVSWGGPSAVPHTRLELPVSGPHPDADGVSLFQVELPRAGLQPVAIEIIASDDHFERQVEVVGLGYGTVERLSLSGAAIDRVRVDLQGEAGARLDIRVTDGRARPLDIKGVRLILPGRRLLVLDAGAGPHRLLAGPVSPDRRDFDLGHAVAELLDARPAVVTPGEAAPNPSFNPLSLLPAGLLRGAEADLGGYRRSRPAEGVAGQLTRWVLPPDLLAERDLQSIRLVDAEGRQVPYLMQPAPPVELQLTQSSRREGKRTFLTGELSSPMAVSHVQVQCSSSAFSRPVALVKGESLTWTRTGPEDAGPLTLHFYESAASKVEVVIHDGDDAALEGCSLRAWAPGQELLAVAPGPGATLWSDGPSDAPSYDLALFDELVRNGALANGSLGPVVVKGGIRMEERTLTLVAIGGMALVLVGLSALLLRKPPEAAST